MSITLRVAHLYPRQMNIYGDRGNIMCLQRRCNDREIAFALTELGPGDVLRPGAFDLIFAGGAQDREQRIVIDDFMATKAGPLRDAVENARLRFDAIFITRPSHNPVGPFDFLGAYDEGSDRHHSLQEVMVLGYEDVYRQFIDPIVGGSGEQLAGSP